MTSRDFCYWLQGYFEIQVGRNTLDVAQTKCIQKHLALVFKHEIDPSYGDDKHQQELNKIHSHEEILEKLEKYKETIEAMPNINPTNTNPFDPLFPVGVPVCPSHIIYRC